MHVFGLFVFQIGGRISVAVICISGRLYIVKNCFALVGIDGKVSSLIYSLFISCLVGVGLFFIRIAVLMVKRFLLCERGRRPVSAHRESAGVDLKAPVQRRIPVL